MFPHHCSCPQKTNRRIGSAHHIGLDQQKRFPFKFPPKKLYLRKPNGSKKIPPFKSQKKNYTSGFGFHIILVLPKGLCLGNPAPPPCHRMGHGDSIPPYNTFPGISRLCPAGGTPPFVTAVDAVLLHLAVPDDHCDYNARVARRGVREPTSVLGRVFHRGENGC